MVPRIPVLRLAVLVPLTLLAACGPGRDTDLAEKLARAEAAARRAEKAADAAEKAAAMAAGQARSAPAAADEAYWKDDAVEGTSPDAAAPADEPAQPSAE